MNQRGAALITLLIVTAASMLLLSAMSLMVVNTLQSTTTIASSHQVYYAAEAGIENALLLLIRNPSYSGEELNISDVDITITVSGTDPIYITAVARRQEVVKTIMATVSNTSGELEVIAWKEI